MRSLILLPLLGLTLIACGGGGGGGSGGGGGGNANAAPRISELSYSPEHVYVNEGGGQLTISGSASFSDQNGDLSSVTVNVLDSAGQTVATAFADVADFVSGVTSGRLTVEVTFDTTVAGDFTVRVFGTDSGGSNSNLLNGQFKITDFPWVEKAPMLTTDRSGFSTTAIDGLIYIFGGEGLPDKLDTVEIYDPLTDTWAPGPPMPFGMSRHVSATVNGKIYVFGFGNDPTQFGGGNELEIALEFDPTDQTWTTLLAEYPASQENPHPERGSGRFDAGVAVYNDLIYVAGGGGYLGRDEDPLVWYDPASDTWTAGSPPPVEVVNTGARAAALDNRIFVIGGQRQERVEAYDPFTDTWSTRADLIGGHERFAVAVFDEQLFTFGAPFSFVGDDDDEVWAYDPWDDRWRRRTSLPMGANYGQAEVVGEKIYVFAFDRSATRTFEYTPSNDKLW